MPLKRMLVLGAKIIALTIAMFLFFAVAAAVSGLPGGAGQSQTEQANAAPAILAVCFLNTATLTFLILRSRWIGLRLMATMFFVSYGVTTVMSQIESAVFITRLPPGTLPRLFLMGFLVYAPFSVLAVLVLGKRRPAPTVHESNPRLIMPMKEWAWKLSALAIVYVSLYFTFGYFIAWQNPAVRAYYDGADAAGGFFAQMGVTLSERPWLLPFQILRALMWMLLAMPVVRMLREQRWEAALAVGLLFAVVMNTQLLLPNPFMPEDVRMAHLVETASSNFIFGGLVGWLLYQSDDKSVAVATSRA